ncbi:Uma2 family endonuclease [Streptacidiphilus sp. P02-A3a]|uniref:Uma2 family endonuclease n=1 Tax=Streptacidiphilus sp. P02-A3a TaxID=2704468 RepID=UPI0015F789AF|nr:Uma2 family endonuclease [Streptacidiphilus sp. P02-A3a]QMU72388.1 Uma2 family endonuclease [Streptacidiphilus sp. P02-A3a]
MSAATIDFAELGGSEPEGLLEAFLALETPEGFKAELIEGEIIVTPSPDGKHERLISLVNRQIYSLGPADLEIAGTKGLIVPDGRFIPDATYVWEAVLSDQGSWSKPDGVLMVLEVTSRDPQRDGEGKRRGYAAAGVPLYLLADRQRELVILHSDPKHGDYSITAVAKPGDPLTLPQPFGFDLDTSKLF